MKKNTTAAAIEQCKNCCAEISLTHIDACGACGYGRKPTTDEHGKSLRAAAKNEPHCICKPERSPYVLPPMYF